MTVCEGGAPLTNAWVSVDGRLYGATIANGTYDAILTAGSHTYSVSKPTFDTATGNFNITNGQTTNVPACLSGATPTPNTNSNSYSYSCSNCYTYTHSNSTSTYAKAAAHAVSSTDALRMVG